MSLQASNASLLQKFLGTRFGWRSKLLTSRKIIIILLAYAEWVNVAKGGGQSFFLEYAQWVNVAKLSLTAEIFEGRRLQDCH